MCSRAGGFTAHLRDGGVEKTAVGDVKSRAGNVLGIGDDRDARRVRDGSDDDESAASSPGPAHRRREIVLLKNALVCEKKSCLVHLL